MFEKIKFYIVYFIKRCKDVRFLVQVGFVIVAIMISWSTIRSIQTNYELQRQIAEEEQKNQVQKIKNENLRLKNKYLETDEYLELAARRQFGKAALGETVIVIPKRVAYTYAKKLDFSSREQFDHDANQQKPFYQKNVEAWGKFFFPPR